MKVKATDTGFYDGSRRRPGAVFDLKAGDKVAKWMIPVDDPEADKPKVEKADKPKVEKADKPKVEK